MTYFTSPARVRLIRIGVIALVLCCEHWRWLTHALGARVPRNVLNVLLGEDGSGPRWGELLSACLLEGVTQCAQSAIQNPVDAILCAYAIAQTILLVRGVRQSKRKIPRGRSSSAKLISTKMVPLRR